MTFGRLEERLRRKMIRRMICKFGAALADLNRKINCASYRLGRDVSDR
jgi:hypothetical protein